MGTEHAPESFRTTRWTLIARARSNAVAFDELLDRYATPILAYYRVSGRQDCDAEDLAQGFVAHVMHRVVDHADEARGRFRNYLKKALERYAIDEYRRNGNGRVLLADPGQLDAAQSANGEASAALDREWARLVLDRALAEMERRCQRPQSQKHWLVFEARVLRPSIQGLEPIAYEQLVSQLGARSMQEVYTILKTAKAKFARLLREIVAETVDDDAEIDAEIAELLQIVRR